MSRNFSRKGVDIWIGIGRVRALTFGVFLFNPLEDGVGTLSVMYMNTKGFFNQCGEASITNQFFQIKNSTRNLSFQ